MSEPFKRPLILALSVEQDADFGHVVGRLLTRREDGTIVNWSEDFSGDQRSPQIPALEDLNVSCQWSHNVLVPYAWACEFHQPYNVDLNRARRMVEQELASAQQSPAREINKARKQIADLVLEMAAKGEIELHPEPEDEGPPG